MTISNIPDAEIFNYAKFLSNHRQYKNAADYFYDIVSAREIDPHINVYTWKFLMENRAVFEEFKKIVFENMGQLGHQFRYRFVQCLNVHGETDLDLKMACENYRIFHTDEFRNLELRYLGKLGKDDVHQKVVCGELDPAMVCDEDMALEPMTIRSMTAKYLPIRFQNGMPSMKALFVKPEFIFTDNDDDADDVEVHIGIDSGSASNVLSYDSLSTLYESGVLDDGNKLVDSTDDWIYLVDRIEFKDMALENVPFRIMDTDNSWLGNHFLTMFDSYSIDYKNLSINFN